MGRSKLKTEEYRYTKYLVIPLRIFQITLIHVTKTDKDVGMVEGFVVGQLYKTNTEMNESN